MIGLSDLFAQKIDFYGGVNFNKFHDYNTTTPHFNSSYNSDYGFSAGLGLDSIKLDWLILRFTLQFDKYKGKLNVTNGGLGGSWTTIANVDKSIISIGIFPVNFQILKRIDFNLGFLVSRLIDETYTGTSNGWTMNQPNWNYNLHDKFNKFSSSTYYGFQGRIAYNFKLSKSLWISSQYLYYFGLSNEFIEFPEDTKAMRHYFCIGIKKTIK
jgi:hypothetical protein